MMWKDFIKQVEDGTLLSCEYVKLAVKRHLRDMARQNTPEFPYYFDETEANRMISLVKKHRHTKGEFAGQLFDLQLEQAFTFASVFGWRKVSNNKRRFTKVYKEKARKGGKTEEAAVVGNIGLIADREEGSEVYMAATKRDQAKICFEASKIMLRKLSRDSETINRLVNISKFNIAVESTGSKMEPLASDSDKLDGLNPHFAIIDEYHAHKDSGLLEVIETGQGARLQPLLYIITTAGFNKQSPCYHFRKVCIDILRGIKEDESVFTLIFTLDKDDDWRDETLWIKANPNIGKAPYWDYMRGQYLKAINEGASKEIQFKTKNLNVWTSTGITWIPDEKYQKCEREYKAEDLRGQDCYGGLDLASVRDITAFVLVFPGEEFKTLYYFFCPEETVQNNLDEYWRWARDGHIITTPGNVTDYNWVKAKIIEIAENHNLKTVFYDRWNSSQLVIDLIEEGLKFETMGQGFASMSAPAKELERMFLQEKITHNGNPVQRWMMSNVEMKLDPAGNIKPDKEKSTEKIDGVAALVMAYSAYMNEEREEDSNYNTRGIVSI